MNFKIFMLLTYRGDGRGEAGGGRWAKTLQNLSYPCPCEAQYRAAKAVCGRHGLYSYLGRNLLAKRKVIGNVIVFCLFVGFFLSFLSKNMGRQLQAVFSALKNLAMPGKFNINFFQQKAHL